MSNSTAGKTAVVLAMMDASGSMGEFEKGIARDFYRRVIDTLRTHYHSVVVHYLVHGTEAQEVSEDKFFAIDEGGGTRCSTVYQLALNIAKWYGQSHFTQYDIFPFHVTDGDNLSSDKVRAVQGVNDLLSLCGRFKYLEIKALGDVGYYHYHTLADIYSDEIHHNGFHSIAVADHSLVASAVQCLLSLSIPDPTDPIIRVITFPDVMKMLDASAEIIRLILNGNNRAVTFLTYDDQLKTAFMFKPEVASTVNAILDRYTH